MRIIRALVGSLLWILAGVLGLVGVLLCATLILAPVGIPVLMLARKLFAYAMTMFLPRGARHPVDELGKSARKQVKRTKHSVPDVDTKALKKTARKTRKKGGKIVKHQRKRFA